MQARRPRFGNLLSCDEATRAAVPAVVVAGLVSEALNEVDTRLCPRRWRCGSGSSRAEALRRVLSVLSLAAERDLRLCEPRIAKHFTARRPRLRPGPLLGLAELRAKQARPARAKKKMPQSRLQLLSLGFRRFSDFGRASGHLQCAVANTVLRTAIPTLQRSGAGASSGVTYRITHDALLVCFVFGTLVTDRVASRPTPMFGRSSREDSRSCANKGTRVEHQVAGFLSTLSVLSHDTWVGCREGF